MSETESNNRVEPTGFLFDLDGVIIDSETEYTKIWAEIDRLYPTGYPDFTSRIKGMTLPKILDTYFDMSVREEVNNKCHELESHMTFTCFPGAVEVLKAIKSAGARIAIVTSSDNVKMKLLYGQIPQLWDLADVIVDANMVTKSKPDPQGYLLGAQKIGVNIKNCAVVEDALNGLEAGRRSGAYVVGIATTTNRDKMGDLPDVAYPSIAEMEPEVLIEVLKKR